jgi:hypothetical protein
MQGNWPGGNDGKGQGPGPGANSLPHRPVYGPIRHRHAPEEPPAMAFDDLKAELALLINQMENQPEDPHELYLQIRERLNEMRAYGMPLPEDLVEFEKEMEAQFAATEKAAKKD